MICNAYINNIHTYNIDLFGQLIYCFLLRSLRGGQRGASPPECGQPQPQGPGRERQLPRLHPPARASAD